MMEHIDTEDITVNPLLKNFLLKLCKNHITNMDLDYFFDVFE